MKFCGYWPAGKQQGDQRGAGNYGEDRETHRAKIMLKLNVHSIAELIHYALGRGLTDSPLSS